MATFEIRRIVRELKKQRRQIDQAIDVLEGVEKKSAKQQGGKARVKLLHLPPVQSQDGSKGQVLPFIRPVIVVEAKRSFLSRP